MYNNTEINQLFLTGVLLLFFFQNFGLPKVVFANFQFLFTIFSKFTAIKRKYLFLAFLLWIPNIYLY